MIVTKFHAASKKGKGRLERVLRYTTTEAIVNTMAPRYWCIMHFLWSATDVSGLPSIFMAALIFTNRKLVGNKRGRQRQESNP